MTSQFYLLFFLTFCACTPHYNIIRSFNDEFKNSRKHLVHQYIVPEEHSFPVSSVYLTFEKETTDIDNTIYHVYFVFTRGTTTFDIDRKGFIRIGDTKFDIETQSIHSELRTTENTSTSTTTDSTGTRTVMSSETVHFINDKFKVNLTSDMIDLLKQKKSLMFRFYSGPNPITLVVRDLNMKRLQELLAAP